VLFYPQVFKPSRRELRSRYANHTRVGSSMGHFQDEDITEKLLIVPPLKGHCREAMTICKKRAKAIFGLGVSLLGFQTINTPSPVERRKRVTRNPVKTFGSMRPHNPDFIPSLPHNSRILGGTDLHG